MRQVLRFSKWILRSGAARQPRCPREFRDRCAGQLPLAVLIVGLMSSVARAQVVDTTTWGFSPGDRVLAIAQMDNTIYLGGSFLCLGPSTGGGVPCDARTAQPLAHYPRVVGRLDQVLPDGAGGWYLAGTFTYVGDVPRRNLAHVLADGTVDGWDPSPSSRVRTIAVSGETLFAGGDFDSVGGQPRAHLAALSTSSSQALPWQCDVNSLVLTTLVDGTTLYIGGWFTVAQGQPRAYVAAVDGTSGVLLPWQVALDGKVRALAVQETTLYIGGYFYVANGASHRCLAAVGKITGAVHAWDPVFGRTPVTTIDSGAHVSALLPVGDSLFVAGSFTTISGLSRPGIAQIDLATAQPTLWSPTATYPRSLGAEFWSLLRSGDTLFVAGEFDSLAGAAGGNVSAVSVSTGQRIWWEPRTNDYVFALALQGSVLYVGGWFTSIGQEWVARHGLAAIDVTTGRVTGWDPNPNDYVRSLLAYGGRLYVGGFFTSVGGQSRSCVAALDPVTGAALPWNPVASWAVNALAPMGRNIVVGGQFTSIGGRAQIALAAVDTTTGQTIDWNPNTDGDVRALAVTDTAVYVGGDFSIMGGQPRASLAAVDPISAHVSPWNPGTNGWVEAITLLSGSIYIGGYFQTAGGAPRSCLAALDPSGAPTSWRADAFGPAPGLGIHALASADSTVFAGGYYSGVSGVSSEWLSALDSRTGAIRTNYPHPDGPVWSLECHQGTVYVGGAFGRVGIWPQICFAAIAPDGDSPGPLGRALWLSQCSPNPVRSSTSIRYSLPEATSVSLVIYDVQGRRVTSPVAAIVQEAGEHAVDVQTRDLRPGCYLYRLEASGRSATRKMLVVH